MRWLIATDLDGTLFDEDLRVSPRVRETIAAAQRAGHAVTMATGRMFRATAPIALELGVAQPLICYQGALVRQGEEVIHHQALPLEVAREVVELAQGRGIHLNAYVDDRLFVPAVTPEATYYQSLSPMVDPEPVGDLLTFLEHEPTKLVFILPDSNGVEELLAEATERWGEVAQVVRSHPRFVELTHPAVSKGRALMRLAETLSIPRERVLAVGDNLNDCSMIEAAGIGVAMGNAPPVLREIADWVAPTVHEDGLAVAIERFVLNGRVNGSGH